MVRTGDLVRLQADAPHTRLWLVEAIDQHRAYLKLVHGESWCRYRTADPTELVPAE